MSRFFMFLLCFSFIGCVSTPKKDEVVSNSLDNLKERPTWTVEGRFREFLKSLTEKEQKDNLYRVGSYSTKSRTDMDLCFQYARSKVETEISQSVGQAVSAVVSEAIAQGNIQEETATRVQELTAASKTKMAIAGLEVEEKFWQQIAKADSEGNVYECFVLAKMPGTVYKKQLKSSIAKILSEENSDTKERLNKAVDETDSLIDKTFNR